MAYNTNKINTFYWIVINEKKNHAKREKLKIFPKKAEKIFFLLVILLHSLHLWTYGKAKVFRESSLSDRKKILSDLVFGSFLTLLCLSAHSGFHSSIPSLASLALLQPECFLLVGLMFWISWMTMLLRVSLVKNRFDQSDTSMHTSLSNQSLTAPSFLNCWP